MKPRLSMIAAMARNRVIGRDGGLPWRLPADMKHFVRLTRGKPIITGRRNYEDIGRPLPGRHTIVLTRDPAFRAPGCTVVSGIDTAIAAAGDVDEIMVIGGEAVYRGFLPRTQRIYLTLVEAEIDGDTHFPELDPACWRERGRETRPADADNPYAMTFIEYDRI
jgi:dihydrofolate reductase